MIRKNELGLLALLIITTFFVAWLTAMVHQKTGFQVRNLTIVPLMAMVLFFSTTDKRELTPLLAFLVVLGGGVSLGAMWLADVPLAFRLTGYAIAGIAIYIGFLRVLRPPNGTSHTPQTSR